VARGEAPGHDPIGSAEEVEVVDREAFLDLRKLAVQFRGDFLALPRADVNKLRGEQRVTA
jgi:hypothetical protein